jgi:hypothetical protein
MAMGNQWRFQPEIIELDGVTFFPLGIFPAMLLNKL